MPCSNPVDPDSLGHVLFEVRENGIKEIKPGFADET
jgi:hypothetical protein